MVTPACTNYEQDDDCAGSLTKAWNSREGDHACSEFCARCCNLDWGQSSSSLLGMRTLPQSL